MAKLKETNVRENLYVKGDIYRWDNQISEYRNILAPATENSLGLIMVGNNLSIDANGVLSSIRQPVDDAMSQTSANPVENRVLTQALALKLDANLASSAASITNPLADKAYVQDLVKTNAAKFRGSFETWNAVPVTDSGGVTPCYEEDEYGSRTPSNNDYIIVADASGFGAKYSGTWQFTYSGTWDNMGKNGWKPLYQISEKGWDADQLAAINSKITRELVDKFKSYEDEINARALIGHKHSAYDITNLADIATVPIWQNIQNIPAAGDRNTPVYFTSAGPVACSFKVNVPETTTITTLTSIIENGWYKWTGTLESFTGTWLILKIDILHIAYALFDPKLELRSTDKTNWYTPYSDWYENK